MLTMRSYCSLITPPLPRIFLIWGRKDRRGKSKNSCNNIFDGVEWDWERGDLDGGDQRSSHSKMRMSPCCSVLTCKLSSCWSLLCSWCWSLLCFWCWSLLGSWCWWYFSRDADEGCINTLRREAVKYNFAERYYHSAKKYLTASLTGKNFNSE